MVKIVIVSEYFLPYVGGGQIHIYELARELAKRHEIHIITKDLGIKKLERMKGFTIHRIGKNKIDFIRKCKKLIEELNPDIIHSHVFIGSLAAYFSKKKPHVTTVHGVYSHISIPAKIIQKKILGLDYDKIIAVSHFTKVQLVKMGADPKNIVVIHNGVDTDRFRPMKYPKECDIAYFGRLDKVKGVDNLLKTGLNEKIFIYGEGPEKKSLQNIAKRMGANVSFKNSVKYSEMPRKINSTSLVVLPSIMEGLPLIVLESLSCGVPIICTDVGGIREIKAPGIIIVKPGNPVELAEAIKDSLRQRRKISRVYIKNNFSWKAAALKTEALYLAIMTR